MTSLPMRAARLEVERATLSLTGFCADFPGGTRGASDEGVHPFFKLHGEDNVRLAYMVLPLPPQRDSRDANRY